MKRFSKILLAAVAASVMAVPMANAQPRPDGSRQVPHRYERQVPPQWQPAPKYKAAPQYKPAPLRKPPAGQQWVKVDNDYVLLGIATGLITSIIAGR